jgi:hypothetical protein
MGEDLKADAFALSFREGAKDKTAKANAGFFAALRMTNIEGDDRH